MSFIKEPETVQDIKPENQDANNVDNEVELSDVKDKEDITDDEELEEELEKIEKTECEGDAIVKELHIDMIQDELTLFESIIGYDIYETMIVQESGDPKEVKWDGDVKEKLYKKIIDSGKVALQKIMLSVKSLIDSFLIKLDELMKGSNKKIIEKYSEKLKGKDLTNFKYMWSTYRSKPQEVYPMDNYSKSLNAVFMNLYKEVEILKTGRISNNALADSVGPAETRSNILYKIFNVKLDSNTDINKGIISGVFEDKKEKTNISMGLLKDIEGYLKDSKGIIKDIKNTQSLISGLIRQIASSYDTTSLMTKLGAMNKQLGKEKSDFMAKALNKSATNHRVRASAISMAVSVMLNMYKMKMKECRNVYVGAANYNESKVNNSSDQSNDKDIKRIEESVRDYEVDEIFEGIFV